MKVVISSAGIVSPFAIGYDKFCDFLFADKKNTALFAGEVQGFEFSDYFGRKFRRSARLTQFALVAVKEALENASLLCGEYDGTRAALVVGVTHGAISLTLNFHSDLVTIGQDAASPALFSDSVLNAQTGNVSLAFAIRGPSQTLVGGATASLQALALGVSLIKSGRVDFAIVAATEELNATVTQAYGKFGLNTQGVANAATSGKEGFTFSEGSAALVLESEERAAARGISPLAELCSFASDSGGQLEESIEYCASHALKKACITDRDVSIVTAAADGFQSPVSRDVAGLKPGFRLIEGSSLGRVLAPGTRTTCIKPFTGESFAASTLMSVAATVAMLKQGQIIPNPHCADTAKEWSWAALTDNSNTTNECHTALVSSTGVLEEAACCVLKKIQE